MPSVNLIFYFNNLPNANCSIYSVFAVQQCEWNLNIIILYIFRLAEYVDSPTFSKTGQKTLFLYRE